MKQFDAKTSRPTPDEILEVLLSRLAKGESEALELVYESTRASVYGLAFSYVQQHQDAEDVTHDTYVALYSLRWHQAFVSPMQWHSMPHQSDTMSEQDFACCHTN